MQVEKPPVSEQLQKLCSWAVVAVLDMHPRKGGMPPTLVYKRADEARYRVEVDTGIHESLDALLENARLFLENAVENVVENAEGIEAYAILVDSAEDIPGLPESRPLDDGGKPYPKGKATLFVYLGERDTSEGVLVVQCYTKRPIRGGAATLGTPLIMRGPDSLLRYV